MKIWDTLRHSLWTEDESGRKTGRILKAVFFLYILVLLRVIVFKYPLERLEAITRSWSKSVVLEGLGTANFTFFKTIKMYIRYWGRLNSFENLFGNVIAFIPFGFLLPFVQKESRRWWVMFLETVSAEGKEFGTAEEERNEKAAVLFKGIRKGNGAGAAV